jgi:hypothetical protein
VEMSRRSNIKEGRHVGLDFYDLLIEGTPPGCGSVALLIRCPCAADASTSM